MAKTKEQSVLELLNLVRSVAIVATGIMGLMAFGVGGVASLNYGLLRTCCLAVSGVSWISSYVYSKIYNPYSVDNVNASAVKA